MTTKVYVGNLSYSTTADTLRTLFAEFGEVQSVNVITDRDTGRSKGFAFVEMASNEAASEAIGSLNGKTVDGRDIRVDEAMSVRRGHDISETVKSRLLEEGPDVIDVVVHLEPREAGDPESAAGGEAADS